MKIDLLNVQWIYRAKKHIICRLRISIPDYTDPVPHAAEFKGLVEAPDAGGIRASTETYYKKSISIWKARFRADV